MRTVFFPFLLFLFAAFQCEDDQQQNIQNPALSQVLSSEAGNLPNDAFVLKNARIENAELAIEVQFSGGCKEHQFTLVWPEVITLVYPPDFGIELYHDSQDEGCEALSTQILEFDLTQNPINMSLSDLQAATIRVVNGSSKEASVLVE